jgi:hypothetical protein
MDALPGRRMQDHDIFMAGLTVAEYFALHLEIERELGHYEQEVRPDAIPAR